MGTSLDTPSLRAITAESQLCFVSDDGSGRVLKELPVHAYTLAKASEYFNVQVDFWAKSGGQTAGRGGAVDTDGASPPAKKARREPLVRFVVPIPADALTQAEALVEFMYSGTLTLPPANNKGARIVLQAAVVADAWRLPTCVKQCLEQLTTLSKGATLDLEAVVPTLPDSITSLDKFEELLRTNYASTLDPFFDDADALVTCQGDRSKQFGALSPLLIKLWADTEIKANEEQEDADDNLDANEETAILLITRWWLAQTPAIQQDEDLCLALSHSLLLGDLSAVYLTSVLPGLPWFRGGQSEAFMEVMRRKMLGWKVAKGMPDQGLPGNWSCSGSSPPNALLEWELGRLAGPLPARIDLPAKYDYGFMWSVRIDCNPGEDASVQVLVSSPLDGAGYLDKAIRRIRASMTLKLENGGSDVVWKNVGLEMHGASKEGEVIVKPAITVPRKHLICVRGPKLYLSATLT